MNTTMIGLALLALAPRTLGRVQPGAARHPTTGATRHDDKRRTSELPIAGDLRHLISLFVFMRT
jgi:hypothetical protein